MGSSIATPNHPRIKPTPSDLRVKNQGCACFIDTNIFWLIIQFQDEISLQQFKSSDTIKDLKLRFIKQFNLKQDILFNNEQYQHTINHHDISAESDDSKLQQLYFMKHYRYKPLQLFYKSKNIKKNIKNNQIIFERQYDSLKSLIIISTNNTFDGGIASIIVEYSIGEKLLNLPLPFKDKYIYEHFVDDKILENGMKHLGLDNKNKIINGKYLQNISIPSDGNKLKQYVKFIKDKRMECNNNAVCEVCFVEDFSDGTGNVDINVNINNNTITLHVHYLASVKKLKNLIEIKANITWDKQKIIYAGKMLEDHKHLQDYCLMKGSTLHVL